MIKQAHIITYIYIYVYMYICIYIYVHKGSGVGRGSDSERLVWASQRRQASGFERRAPRRLFLVSDFGAEDLPYVFQVGPKTTRTPHYFFWAGSPKKDVPGLWQQHLLQLAFAVTRFVGPLHRFQPLWLTRSQELDAVAFRRCSLASGLFEVF